jgi:hypothetical protein
MPPGRDHAVPNPAQMRTLLATIGAASWPRSTLKEKVQATELPDVVRVDLIEIAIPETGGILSRHRPASILLRRRRRGAKRKREANERAPDPAQIGDLQWPAPLTSRVHEGVLRVDSR